MQVRSINKSNNTNFNSLYASKKTLKAIRCTRKELLSNRSIREAAEKYDVIVKAGTQNVYKPDPWYPLNTLYRTMLSCGAVGTISALSLMALTDVLALGVIKYTALCSIPAFGMLGLNILYDRYKHRPVKEIVIQAGKGVEPNKDYIKNCGTKEHVIDNPETELPLIREVKEAENDAFERKIRTYDTDDMFSAKKYLDALKNADIEMLGGGDFFNRPIDDKGNTMITSFFDVLPTEENQKEYQEILDIIKNTKGIDYNLKDSGGVSCLEKIMNSENRQAFELVKRFKFKYYPEFDLVYKNIQDKELKQAITNLDITFTDIHDAIKQNSWAALTKLRPLLNSPFCDRSKLAAELSVILNLKHANPQNRADYNAREYIQTYYNEFVNPDKTVKLNEGV